MDREELMSFILDHYESPRNHGSLDNPDAYYEGGNPGCGDIVKMYLKINGENVINEIKFDGEGCILSQAGASIITENVLGKKITEVVQMTPDVITDLIGTEIAMSRPKCTTLGLTTVKFAIKEWNKKNLIKEINS